MTGPARRIAVRLLPLLLVVIVLVAWFADVQQNGPYVPRNAIPPFLGLLPLFIALRGSAGYFRGADPRYVLAALGFAVPSVGLAVYLHHAYAVNLDSLFADARRPVEVFRFLPIYTSGAGLLGAAIGWIAGRSLKHEMTR